MKAKSTWYAIRRRTALAAAALGVAAAAEIYIYGDIGESYWEETVSASSFVRELQAIDADQITVRINSFGGSVPDGLAIFNALRRHKATITTEIDGMAFSIASLIAMAGDHVHMANNAVLMIHAPWTYTGGNSAELRETADQLDTWASAMSTSYALRTGDQAGMLALVTDGQDHYYTAEEALAAKFIDGITDAMPIAASAARDLPLNRYRSVPAALLAPCPSAAPAANSAEEDPMKLRSLLLLSAIGASGAAAAGGGNAKGGGKELVKNLAAQGVRQFVRQGITGPAAEYLQSSGLFGSAKGAGEASAAAATSSFAASLTSGTSLVNTALQNLATAATNAATSLSASSGARGLGVGSMDLLTGAANAMSGDSLENLLSLTGGFGTFAVGTDFVPHDMIAKIHKGEAIVRAADNTTSAEDRRPQVAQFIVGDLATQRMVEAAIAKSESRSAGRLVRSQRMGGALS